MKQKNNIEKSIKSKLFKKTQHYDFTCMVYRNQSYRNAFTKLKKMETNFWFGVRDEKERGRFPRAITPLGCVWYVYYLDCGDGFTGVYTCKS